MPSNYDCRKKHGKVLIINNILQFTERDDCVYHEAISYLPLCSHPKPTAVLILNDISGGIARTVAKHPLVKSITRINDDKKATEICDEIFQFSPNASTLLTTIYTSNYRDVLQSSQNTFDVIIAGNDGFLENDYLVLIKNALKPGGIFCSRSGFLWTELDKLNKVISTSSKFFGTVKHGTALSPFQATGNVGFLLASAEKGVHLEQPKYVFGDEELHKMGVKYYSAEVHAASFVLPKFAREKLVII